MLKIIVLVSGSGTNLQYLIDHFKGQIIGVVYNKKKAYGAVRAKEANILGYYMPYIRDLETREEYDQTIVDLLDDLNPDLVVLAGWMHLLTSTYTKMWGSKTINLHPALPGQFPGAKGMEDAWLACQRGEIDHSGIMVHKVVEEVDAGETICTVKVPIKSDDTFETFKDNMRAAEKPLLLKAVNSFWKPDYVGKVRDMFELDKDTMLVVHSDRLSSFDRHICNVSDKGAVLNQTAVWWFEQTKHIIPNHLLSSDNTSMVVKKCTVIPIEVVVRGYITGSTKTSLWSHYKKGVREYCGHTFRDGYKKNQKLDQIVVTPTTKGETDELISGSEIVTRGILTEAQWQYIEEKALELFRYGQNVAGKRGLLLVDTKYEFGFDMDGKITLIDEIHTCDSSRYWLSESYGDRFRHRLEPERLDKDTIRVWIKNQCDPYVDDLPEIPQKLIKRVRKVYLNFYKMLTGHNLKVSL